jgi:hypothetical protein
MCLISAWHLIAGSHVRSCQVKSGVRRRRTRSRSVDDRYAVQYIEHRIGPCTDSHDSRLSHIYVARRASQWQQVQTHSSITPTIAAMKSLILSALVTQVVGHAIWQDLWVNGVDKGSTCVRLPGTSYVSNSPVTVSHLLVIASSIILTSLSYRAYPLTTYAAMPAARRVYQANAPSPLATP